jgi:hypothetical protein
LCAIISRIKWNSYILSQIRVYGDFAIYVSIEIAADLFKNKFHLHAVLNKLIYENSFWQAKLLLVENLFHTYICLHWVVIIQSFAKKITTISAVKPVFQKSSVY